MDKNERVKILVLNQDKLAPGLALSFKRLVTLGFELIFVEGPDVPAVQIVPDREDRRFIAATAVLQGLLASAPVVDRTKINKTRWAAIACEFSDALLAELDK